jgi:Ser/Thr protein kinase RdoA (MazF antagonist)
MDMDNLSPTELFLGVGRDYPEWVAAMQALTPELEKYSDRFLHTSVVHNDLHLNNILLGAGPSSFTLIDWELSGFGDPAYDAGTFIANLLDHGLGSINGDLSRNPLALGRTFFQSYREVAGLCDEEERRVAQSVGVALLFRARVRLESSGNLGAVGRMSLRIAARALQQPDMFLAQLRDRKCAAQPIHSGVAK